MSKIIAKLRCHCGEMIRITEEDLGFEELECTRCNLINSVPKTLEGIEAQNQELAEEQQAQEAKHARFRIMVEGEDGVEFCARNGLPNDDLLDIIVDGFRARYPEARRVFLEKEEDYRSISIYDLD